MTIGITGPERKVPRQSAVVGWIVAAIVVGICLILLGFASDFLVDWLWFSSIGYLQVFWTTIGAKAVVFFAVWTATAVNLWLNGWLAVRFARRQPRQSATGRSVGVHARSAAVAPGYRRQRRFARSDGCCGGSRLLGRLPAVFLSRTLWCRRPALQHGHQFLSLRTASLYHHQKLDAAHTPSERAFRRNDLLGARRH